MSIVSTTTLESLSTNKKIILLEDVHEGMGQAVIDPEQRLQINKFLKVTQKQTDLIIELSPATTTSHATWYAQTGIVAWLRRTFSLPSMRPAPALLLSQLFVDSIHNQQAWKRVTCHPTDERTIIDEWICAITLQWLQLNMEMIAEKKYKETLKSNLSIAYTSQEDLFLTIKKRVLHDLPKVAVQTHLQRLSELENELETIISAIAQSPLATDVLIATIKHDTTTALHNAQTTIRSYVSTNENLTINQLTCTIFEEQQSFEKAWPIIETLMHPAMLLCDLGFLQKILACHEAPDAKNIILFAGLYHTLAVENYLTQLGYFMSTHTTMTWAQKNQHNTFDVMRQLPPALLTHLLNVTQ
ncbi:MAG TPA: hypothetical protein VGT41_01790 [Candidatus Babeliales bacterium]|nr:hypothetical protein [Candidatus Babeliales bacterium]